MQNRCSAGYTRSLRRGSAQFDAQEQRPLVLPAFKDLFTLLANRNIDPIPHRPTGTRRWSGDAVSPIRGRKSTVVGNLLRAWSMATVSRRICHSPPVKHAVLITLTSENTIKRWLRDQGITSTKAVADVIVLPARYRRSIYSMNHAVRHGLRGCGPGMRLPHPRLFRSVLDALGLDENRDAGSSYSHLMRFCRCRYYPLSHRATHGTRQRTCTRRLTSTGLPGSIWRIVRETEKPDSARYFSAYGRDVDVHEGQFSFHPSTRQLTTRRVHDSTRRPKPPERHHPFARQVEEG